uniref:Receptor-type tyrosine-protein phosphatase H n=1 Tax=Microcebus murinus TaxID=30608 RepID=A0A8C5V4F8_MICMU
HRLSPPDLGSSPVLHLCGQSAPNPVRNLRVENQTNSSISLSWDVPEGPEAQSYTYWVQCTGDDDRNETRITTDTWVTVDGLEPGSSYACSVRVEAEGLLSTIESLSTATAPNPVRNLIVEAQTNSSISLSWDVPEGPEAQSYTYWVQRTGDGGRNEFGNTTNNRVTVDGLEPGSSYEFQVWVEKNGVRSSGQSLSSSTGERPQCPHSVLKWGAYSDASCRWARDYKSQAIRGPIARKCLLTCGAANGQGISLYSGLLGTGGKGNPDSLLLPPVPNTVTSLSVQDQTKNSITLSWAAPEGPGHFIYTYWVSWVDEGIIDPRRQNTLDTGITLKDWNLGACTTSPSGCRGRKSEAIPGPLVEVMDLQTRTQTNNSVTLWWKAPEDPYSQLYIYQVQWASGGHPQRAQDLQGDWANQTSRTNETWYEVEALEPGTLYNFSVWAVRNNVTSSTQSLRASTAPDSVTVISCASTSGGYGVILTWSCPSGGYEAFELEVGVQRGSQDRSACGQGVPVSGLGPARSYPATITTVWGGMRAQSAPVTCHTESAGVIAGAIVGVLLFLILVGLLVFFLKRSFPEYILAKDFAEHVRKNEEDSNWGFADEYQQLALESWGHSQMVASAPENCAKNRYTNVLPYDWSRVSLKPLHGEPGSDYINASFMPGLHSPLEFIATQGPLPNTVGDFWRLVWEQQSRTLVMLTNCMESGRVKCEHYWPLDAQPCIYGHLRVTLVGEEVTENWAVRDLLLFQVEEQKTLPVRQFQYLAWPDHGVPHSPDPLLAFWKMLRMWLDQAVEGGPPIVHCSAGVGRTGTLIALDVLLRQLECDGFVGPFSFVKKMRESRPLMVQTEAQYIFLHQCILRFLQQSASVWEEATYENVTNLIYENVAAIQAQEVEA